jgi:DNA-binding MarR family transcriptional regulator
MPASAQSQPEPEALRLSAFLPYRLSVLTNTISRRIADRYDAAFGVSIWQWRVMAVLGEAPGLSATEVAERTAMDKVAVSRAVAGLIARAYVARTAAPEDGRLSRLRLTKAGQDVYRRIVPIALASERELTQALSPEQMAALTAALDALAVAVSPERPLW